MPPSAATNPKTLSVEIPEDIPLHTSRDQSFFGGFVEFISDQCQAEQIVSRRHLTIVSSAALPFAENSAEKDDFFLEVHLDLPNNLLTLRNWWLKLRVFLENFRIVCSLK